MAVGQADIHPGQCFLSQGGKPGVVRVRAAWDGVVRFKAKGKRSGWSSRAEAALPEFLASLMCKVGCD